MEGRKKVVCEEQACQMFVFVEDCTFACVCRKRHPVSDMVQFVVLCYRKEVLGGKSGDWKE